MLTEMVWLFGIVAAALVLAWLISSILYLVVPPDE
jgi:hypothetical protein